MKRIHLLIIIIFLLSSFASCSIRTVVTPNNQNNDIVSAQGGYFDMKQDEAKRNLEEDASILLVDVRTPQEYEEQHIPGSVLIPLDNIKNEAEEKLVSKDETIYVYCRSGNRSASAAKILADLGYTKVYNIGGISTWSYETEKGGN